LAAIALDVGHAPEVVVGERAQRGGGALGGAGGGALHQRHGAEGAGGGLVLLELDGEGAELHRQVGVLRIVVEGAGEGGERGGVVAGGEIEARQAAVDGGEGAGAPAALGGDG